VTDHISTGSNCIDGYLKGGIPPATITLIYGEPETGKSTLAIQIAANCCLQNKKVLYVDCDNTFYTQRLEQITGELKFNQVAEQIILIKPKDFTEQTVLVDHLQDYTTKNFGLIVIDTLTNLYRAKVAETGAKAKTFALSRELNRQLALLAQTAKIVKLPIIVISQVKSTLNEPTITIAPVATRVQQFWADTIIQLKPTQTPTNIQAILEKMLDQNTQKPTCPLTITQTGIHDT
jgi:RecA/RadA recombinase